jgi:CDP-diacylglycerol--glycerol-3-phosphate 3-phosphatidyltransferase
VNGPAVMKAAPTRSPSDRLVTVANGLTLLRIVLVPVFAGLLIASGMNSPGLRIGAALAFGIASLTDFADGFLARAMNQITTFGQVADPIADKALTGTALVLLSIYDRLPWWVTVVIMGREIGITALRLWVIRYGVIPASRGGKLKTALLIAAITWYILPFPASLAAVGPWLMGLATAVTVVTGVDYVVRALRLRAAARS